MLGLKLNHVSKRGHWWCLYRLYPSVNQAIIGSDNGLSAIRCQAIILTNAHLLPIGPQETNFIQILIEIQTFSLKKMHWKCLQNNDNFVSLHYCDVIMGANATQITSLTVVYWTVYSDADQRKHQSSASLAFCVGNSPGPVNAPHKEPVTRKMFPFDDVIVNELLLTLMLPARLYWSTVFLR